MSRSYKQPIIKEGYKSKRKRISKRFASKAIRRAAAVSSGMFYKKNYSTTLYSLNEFNIHHDINTLK